MKREHVTPRDNSWGRAINWFDFAERRVSGHLTPLPSIGDTFLAEMQSGRQARFRFKKVQPCGDPDDMFFGSVEFVEFTDAPSTGPQAMSHRHVPAKALWFCAAIMVLWTAWAYRDALATWWW